MNKKIKLSNSTMNWKDSWMMQSKILNIILWILRALSVMDITEMLVYSNRDCIFIPKTFKIGAIYFLNRKKRNC